MHRVIMLVVEAESEEGAVEAAQEKFEEKLRHDAPSRLDGARYDYCVPMVSGETVAGTDRWTAFQGEPAAAPLGSEQGRGWVEEFLEYQKDHYAEGLYGFFQSHMETLDKEGETGADAIRGMVTTVEDTRDDETWSSGGELLLERFEETIDTMHLNGYGNHYVSMLTSDAGECHVFNFLGDGYGSFVHRLLQVENMEEHLDDPPEDAWVVPLDVHH